MNPNHLKKMNRQEQILLSLDKLGFATRSQLQRLHDLGSNRNANRILKDLSEYLSSFRDIENVYYLNKAGRERIGSDKAMHRKMNWEHILLRNDLYISFKPIDKNWIVEKKLAVAGIEFVPDVYYIDKDRMYFIEIDNVQKMQVNKQKVNRYLKIKEQFNKSKAFPTILWYTRTESRREKLMKMCKGLDTIVYTVQDLY